MMLFNHKKGGIATALSDFYAVVILILILLLFFFLFTFSSLDSSLTAEQLLYATDASALGEQLLRSSVTAADQPVSFSDLITKVYHESSRTSEKSMTATLTTYLQLVTSALAVEGQTLRLTITVGDGEPFFSYGTQLPVQGLGVSGGGMVVHPSILSSTVFLIPRRDAEPFHMNIVLQCAALGSCTKKV